MSEVVQLSKASIFRNKLPALIFGYLLSSKVLIPNDVTQIIDMYIPKEIWIKTGKYCKISGSILVYQCEDNALYSTGYSSGKAIIDAKSSNGYLKYIWEVNIVEKAKGGKYIADIRIGKAIY